MSAPALAPCTKCAVRPRSGQNRWCSPCIAASRKRGANANGARAANANVAANAQERLQPENRTARGQWAAGNRANPGGRPKDAAEVRELARQRSPQALDTLTAIMEDDEAPPAARVAAANAVLDRGWGKPVQAIEQKGEQQLIFVVGRTLPKSYDPLGPALPAHVTDGEITPDTEEILDITAEPPQPPRNGHRYPGNGSRA